MEDSELKDLENGLRKLVGVIKTAIDERKEGTETTKENTNALEDTALQLIGLNVAIKETFLEADRIAVKGNALSIKSSNLLGKVSEDLKGLEGGAFVGLENKLLMLGAGLRKNNSSLLRLAQKGLFTDQNISQLVQTFSYGNAIGRMSNSEISNLANILENSTGVSLDNLSMSIQNLKDVMPALGLLNLGGPVAGAVAELTSYLGANFEPQLQQTLRLLLGNSEESFMAGNRLGISLERSALLGARSSTEASLLIRQTLEKVSPVLRSIQRQYQDITQAGGATILGEQFLRGQGLSQELLNSLVSIDERFQEGNNLSQDLINQNYASFETFKSEFLDPARQFFTSVGNPTLEFMSKNANLFYALGTLAAINATGKIGNLLAEKNLLQGGFGFKGTLSGFKSLGMIVGRLVPVVAAATAISFALDALTDSNQKTEENTKALVELERAKTKLVPNDFMRLVQQIADREIRTKLFGAAKTTEEVENQKMALEELKSISSSLKKINTKTGSLNPSRRQVGGF